MIYGSHFKVTPNSTGPRIAYVFLLPNVTKSSEAIFLPLPFPCCCTPLLFPGRRSKYNCRSPLPGQSMVLEKTEKASYLCTMHSIQHTNTLWVQREAKFLHTKCQQLNVHVRQACSVFRRGSGTTAEEPLLGTRSTAGGQPGESPCKAVRC